MARIGVIELYSGSGWVEVEVAELADVEKPAVEVWTGSQWGAIPLADPADADTAIEVYDGSQWWGVSKEAIQLIDSHEDGNHDEYTDVSGGLYDVIRDSSLAKDGDYLVDFGGNTGSASGLNSTSNLPAYPAPGDVFESHTRFKNDTDYGGIQFAFEDESDAFPDGYRCQIDGGDGRIEIIVQTGGGGTFNTIATASINLSNHLDEWLRHKVSWASNGDLQYTVFDSTDTQLAQTPTVNDTTYTTQGGFGYASETNGSPSSNRHVYHDYSYISGSA